MALPPILREKRRYIAFRLLAKEGFTENQVKQALRQSVLNLVGEEGFASSDFDVIYFSPEGGEGIVRTTNRMLDKTIAALTLIDAIQGKKAGILVLGVSGTIKRTRQKFLLHNPNKMV